MPSRWLLARFAVPTDTTFENTEGSQRRFKKNEAEEQKSRSKQAAAALYIDEAIHVLSDHYSVTARRALTKPRP